MILLLSIRHQICYIKQLNYVSVFRCLYLNYKIIKDGFSNDDLHTCDLYMTRHIHHSYFGDFELLNIVCECDLRLFYFCGILWCLLQFCVFYLQFFVIILQGAEDLFFLDQFIFSHLDFLIICISLILEGFAQLLFLSILRQWIYSLSRLIVAPMSWRSRLL